MTDKQRIAKLRRTNRQLRKNELILRQTVKELQDAFRMSAHHRAEIAPEIAYLEGRLWAHHQTSGLTVVSPTQDSVQ